MFYTELNNLNPCFTHLRKTVTLFKQFEYLQRNFRSSDTYDALTKLAIIDAIKRDNEPIKAMQ